MEPHGPILVEDEIMINSRNDLRKYLEEDRLALHIDRNHPKLIGDEIWRYEIILRKHEYWYNCGSGIIGKLIKSWYALRHHQMSIKLGLQVPINVCDYGLHINHYGLLIISPAARIGKYFNVHQGCNIGVNKGASDAPVIGDNVFFGPGVKIFGDITIADNVAISAGSVVIHSCNTTDVTLGGMPAKIINQNRGNPFDPKLIES